LIVIRLLALACRTVSVSRIFRIYRVAELGDTVPDFTLATGFLLDYPREFFECFLIALLRVDLQQFQVNFKSPWMYGERFLEQFFSLRVATVSEEDFSFL